MTKSAIRILMELAKNDCKSPLKSYTVEQLTTSTEEYSYSKVYADLTALYMSGYVLKGLKNSRAETYYISEQGLIILRGYIK